MAYLVTGKYTRGEQESKEIESALQRLDRLTLEELRTTTTQTLDIVYGLVDNMRVIIDGAHGQFV